MSLISRVLAGWNVRMVISGKRQSRFFSDSGFGGKTAARRAAEEYRDSLIANRRPKLIKPRPCRVLRGNTSSFQIRIPKSGGGTTTTEFSIQRHGSRHARKLAIQAFMDANSRLGRAVTA